MKSHWSDKSSLSSFETLCKDIKTDVLVIGGGLAGLLIAYLLKQAGIDVVIAEKSRIMNGISGNTTAKITAQHGFIYQKLIKSYGTDYAKLYLKANASAVERLVSLCRDSGCKLEVKDNYVYSYNKYKIEQEYNALQKIGVVPKVKEFLPIPLTCEGAVGFENQAQFNPLELAVFLTKDLKIYENTFIRELVGTTASTDKGRIKANRVVVATHFPFINKHGSYFLKLYQHRSYIIALKNAPEIDAMYVDSGKTGLSFSSFGDYLLLSGGSHRTGKKGGNFDELRAFVKDKLLGAKECFHWVAQDTMSLDGVPYIGNYSKNTPDLYVATGFNKWGMTGSMVSAEIISSMILGKTCDYAEVFSPSRSILKPQLVINGIETFKNYIIPTTKRCPHLGCALKYNKAEHSWDCPCHGSRFSEEGKLLDNPANSDLC